MQFEYSGVCGPIEKLLLAGRYKFEVWGSQGGSGSNSNGGKGGYASGEVELAHDTKIFIHIGSSGQTTSGGCNGGGKVGNGKLSSGGGGTDIRINTDSLFTRIIVAGGGGGGGDKSGEIGGFGGGIKGGNGIYSSNQKYPGVGGSQTSGGLICIAGNNDCPPGSFGYGGNTSSSGGGGGGWYGGSAAYDGDPAGGGSGYVFTEISDKPDGFQLTSNNYLKNTILLGGDESIPPLSSGSSPTIGHSGNGCAKITTLSLIPLSRTPHIAKSKANNWLYCQQTYSFLIYFFNMIFSNSLYRIPLPSSTTILV